MSTKTINRWKGIAVVVTGLLYLAAGFAVIAVPEGGLANSTAPLLYYFALVLTAPTFLAIYSNFSQAAGKLGFTGFVMAVLGSILYSGPAFVLVAGTSGVEAWHDLWGFSMSNVLPLGATLFLIGSTLFGVSIYRSNLFSRSVGILLATGSFLWLITFYLAVPYMLSIANLLYAAALVRGGFALFPANQMNLAESRQTV